MLFKNFFDKIPRTEEPVNDTETDTEAAIEQIKESAEELERVACCTHIGKRESQQDSFGVSSFDNKKGIFAVIADGMGGLSDGDKVSRQVVSSMISCVKQKDFQKNDYSLFEMVSKANRDVNNMLGADNLYKSGSTVVAVLVEDNIFHWVSVGDSYIYLYSKGRLTLLNPLHIYRRELYAQAVNGRISFPDIERDPQKEALTSFIGMGELHFVDGSYEGLCCDKDDLLILMSDGIRDSLNLEEITEILQSNEDIKLTADKFINAVLDKNIPLQDNMTTVIVKMQ